MSEPGVPIQELLRLCIALSDGSIADADFHRLDALLAADAGARGFYLEYTRLAAALEQRAGSQAEAELDGAEDDWLEALAALDVSPNEVAPVDRTDELARRALAAKQQAREARRAAERFGQASAPDINRPLVIPKAVAWLGLAAALGIVATLAVYFGRPAPTTDPSVQAPTHRDPQTIDTPAPVLATVVRTFDARWEGGIETTFVGDGLRQGAHRLVAGRIEIELADGVRVALEAPAAFGLEGPNALSLAQGRLVASVPPSGEGLAVQTPTARIVDSTGTYGLAVRPGDTRLNVFRGEVDLYPANSGVAGAVALGRVGALEACVVDAGGRFEPAAFEPTTYDTFADNGLAPRVTRQTATFRQGAGGYRGTVDTWFSGRTGLNEQNGFPRGNYLRVGAWDGVNQQAILRFDGLFGGADAQVPGDARVVLAELVLHNAPDIRDSFGALSPQGDAFAVHRLHVAWGEADGYGDAPWAGGATPQIDPDDREAQASPLADCASLATAATSYIVPAESWIAMDVTPAVAAWAAGEPNHGFLLQSLGGHPQSSTGQAEGDAIFLASAEYASDPALRPAIVITYLTTDSP